MPNLSSERPTALAQTSTGPVPRVVASPAACALIDALRQRHGDFLIVQSHGCCDGSTPMGLLPAELTLGAHDVQLGTVQGVPFWVSRSQWQYLEGGQVVLDARPGSLGTFSLEDALLQHFTSTQRLWTEAEWAWLQAHPLPDVA
ncbi:DUF779 domain-containing protein [Ideonella livida]|uniref:DUF779 domain-containing protein n=1 Tax=Ideonella livida TaxID=2707176 RepID=A0A7C9PEU4_9BURK|nr:DUF779 domain-containing protein [Ideonella livida]NDY89888.1 DUF779 domain-containing protein [Ideonella livida]